MLKIFFGFTVLFLLNLEAAGVRYKINKVIPYYENGYGINTTEQCEPLVGEKTSTQKLASGCIYPTTNDFSSEANVVRQVPTYVNCNKIEYLVVGRAEFKFCNFENNKRITLSIIEGGRDRNALPVCDSRDPKERCQFFISEEEARGRATLIPLTLTEGCTDCSTQHAPEPQASREVTDLKNSAEDIARAAASTQRSQSHCPAIIEEPKENPDRYFYLSGRSQQDADCSFARYLEYKKLIFSADDVYGVHKNLMLCLMDRESRNIVYKYNSKGEVIRTRDNSGNLVPEVDYIKDWDPRASSDTGAIGLGQFTDETFPDVTNRIAERADYKLYWQNFFSKLNRTPPSKEQLKVDPLLQDYRMRTHCDARCNPEISVGAKGLYLKYIFDQYGNDYESNLARSGVYERNLNILRQLQNKAKNQRLTQEENALLSKTQNEVNVSREYMVFIAGGYNMGPSYIPQSMEGGLGPLQWQRNLSRINGGDKSQVSLHMKAIRNCMINLEQK